MSSLFAAPDKNEPALEPTSSSSSASLSSSPPSSSSSLPSGRGRKGANRLDARTPSHHKKKHKDSDDDEYEYEYDNDAKDGGWSEEEQDEFIALILPFIKSKQLSEQDIQLIRREAKQANLPDECIDRLLQDHDEDEESSELDYYQLEQPQDDGEHQQQRRQELPLVENAIVEVQLENGGSLLEQLPPMDFPLAVAEHEPKEEEQQLRQKKKNVKTVRSKKYKSKEFETIEDVDESENILAYFSRMASLKEGGHLPRLNTEAIESFVPQESNSTDAEHSIEVDLDVGYVNKNLDMSSEYESFIPEGTSWDEDCDERDTQSQASSTIPDGRNRYEPVGYSSSSNDKEDAYESLLLYNDSSPRHVTWDKTFEESSVDATEARDNKQHDKKEPKHTSKPTESSFEPDAAVKVPRHKGKHYAVSTDTSCYGYQQDLDEWKRKRNIARWQPDGKNKSSPFGACHANAAMAVADESLYASQLIIRPPPRLHGMTAVRNLLARAEKRQLRRKDIELRRHIPEEFAVAPKSWYLPYRERCKASPGYVGVDQFSLIETASIVHAPDRRDPVPWELRDVKQHFLYEQSLAFSRNWFGRLRRKRGNDPNKYRPCRVRSMEMPTEKSVASSRFDDCDWTENEGGSKTTASKSWKTHDADISCEGDGQGSRVNKTASLSLSSGDRTDEDSATRLTRSVYTQSVTTRSIHDGASTLFTEDYGSSKWDEDTNTFTSHSAFRTAIDDERASISMDADDLESAGVSAILDAEDEDDDENIHYVGSNDDAVSWHEALSSNSSSSSKSHNKEKGRNTTSRGSDRYISSFSESSNYSDTSSSGSRSRSTNFRSSDDAFTSSSGSFCSSDDSRSSSCSTSSDGSWEDAPECGTFINVKPKLGERVSRVHPDYTSHLLRSRFRKKYLERSLVASFEK